MGTGLVLSAWWFDPETVVAQTAPGSMTLRFLIGSFILLYAIWTDLLARRVSNRVWLVTLAIAALFGVYDLFWGTPNLLYWYLAPGVMALAYILWRLRLLFGGADAKCVMAFALLVPYPPAIIGGGAVYPHLPAWLPLALSMLMNAVVFTLAIPITFALYNLLTGRVHPVAMFLGTRVPFDRVLERPVWVMDWVVPVEGKETDDVVHDEEEDADGEEPLDEEGLLVVDPATLEGARVRLRYMP
ncbi:MAG: A24 family peptidase, partial [Euryarchaeota archaeon]|nr:A24 family peptidase [Euryarchaeota archaeon]